jgi:8-oxo-dGTP pyrophosphatase MutT (NUDIX family)
MPNAAIDYFLDERRLRPGDAAAALIVVGEDERYLMQLRDQKPNIFYPGYWGLFGGAIERGDSPETSLRRELEEELGLTVETIGYFTEFVFDFEFAGLRRYQRQFFEVRISEKVLPNLVLGEGAKMQAFSAREVLTAPRVVPFDAFAIWMHAARNAALRSVADV